MNNAITWFEIPAVDFDRAVEFYNQIMPAPLRKGEFGGQPHGFFAADETGVGGAVVKGNGLPAAQGEGTLIYLNAGDEAGLDQVLSKVESAGGKVLLPKTSIGDLGWFGLIHDTEGNRIGLHVLAAK